MKATRAALLLALPEPVERAVVLDGVDEWHDPLRAFGVDLVDDGNADLVIASAAGSDAALRRDPVTALLVGRASAGPWLEAGYSVERYLPLPSLGQPTLVVPLDRRPAARYALSRLSLPTTRLKRLRNRVVEQAIAWGVPVPGQVTVAHRGTTLPFAVRAAQGYGLPDELDVVLVLGRSVERPALLIFEHGAATPRWIAKLSYVDRVSPTADEHGLGLAYGLGAPVAAHVPRFLGSANVSGWPMSVETAAPGSQLLYLLRSPASRKAKLALIEPVVSWLVDVAGATRVEQGPEAWLADFAVPAVYADVADRDALVSEVVGLPATLMHGDLGPEHVIVAGGEFTVIDWEGAERRGLPLADVAFFLARSLPIVDGEADSGAYGPEEVFARLFRGDSPSAAVLSRHVRAACAATGIPIEKAGAVLSILWLTMATGNRAHFASAWFGDPALGVAWKPAG
jgi:hypothetical protein